MARRHRPVHLRYREHKMSDKLLKQLLGAAQEAGVTHLGDQADRLAEQIKRTLTGIPRAAELKDALNAVDALAALAKQQASPDAQAAGATPVMTREELVAAAESIGMRFQQVREQAAPKASEWARDWADYWRKRALSAESAQGPAVKCGHCGNTEVFYYARIDELKAEATIGAALAQSTPSAAVVGELTVEDIALEECLQLGYTVADGRLNPPESREWHALVASRLQAKGLLRG